MKKIACNMEPGDWLKVSVNCGFSYIKIKSNKERVSVELTPDKIRKLRKQLKRALIEIEGEEKKAQCEEYKPGDRVYLIEGDCEGKDWNTSPSVSYIDISKPVTLVRRSENGRWSLSYSLWGGGNFIGYAFEKSFGRRA